MPRDKFQGDVYLSDEPAAVRGLVWSLFLFWEKNRERDTRKRLEGGVYE